MSNEDEGIDIEDISSASVSVFNNVSGGENDFSDAGRSAVMSSHANQHMASVRFTELDSDGLDFQAMLHASHKCSLLLQMLHILWFVCLCDGHNALADRLPFGTVVSSAETAKLIDVPFGRQTDVGPYNHD